MKKIKAQAINTLQTLWDPSNRDTYKHFCQITGTLAIRMGQLIWLCLCAVFVAAAWSIQTANQSRTKYWNWYQSKAKQENLARAIAKAAWRIVQQTASAIHTYASNYLDQYQGQPVFDDVVPVEPNHSTTPKPRMTLAEFAQSQRNIRAVVQ